MSSFHLGWAWQQFAGEQKLLLMALAELADHQGNVNVPAELLAGMIDSEAQDVYARLEPLIEQELITCHISLPSMRAERMIMTRLNLTRSKQGAK